MDEREYNRPLSMFERRKLLDEQKQARNDARTFFPTAPESLHITKLWPGVRRPIVQGTGTIGGLPFYFHASGCSWDFTVAWKPGGDPVEVSGLFAGFRFTPFPEDYGYYEKQAYGLQGINDAGGMSLNEARAHIQQAAAHFLFYQENGLLEVPRSLAEER